MRHRRCAWTMGFPPCHELATKKVKATYLGQPVDRDVLMCDPHAELAHTLVHPGSGWAIASIEPLAQEATP